MTAINALQEAFVNRWSNLMFLLGKAIRFGMTLVFLLVLTNNVTQIGGYNSDEIIVFFITYHLVDLTTQVVFRGVYLFSNQVRTGEFDFLLLKPISPLFRTLTGRPDITDALFLIPSLGVIAYLLTQINVTITATSLALFLVLFFNSMLIGTAMHIFVLVIGLLTTEVDGVIWMYRDLLRLGQFPITIYLQPLRFLLFFLIPVGMMITVPAEILQNVAPTHSMIVATTIGVGFFFLSYLSWRWALKQYSSASS